MGLRIRFGAELKKSWFQFKAPDIRERLSAIAKAGESFMQSRNLGLIYKTQFSDEGLEVFLHPIEEPLRFYADDGYLIVEGKTSSAGPGYHAFAIEWLDKLAAECGLKWLTDDAALSFVDETGYVADRDFPALQKPMTDQFFALANYVRQADADGLEQFNLSLPLGFEVRGDYFCISGLGFWRRDFFDNPKPELFYPWWNQGLDATALAGMATCKIWTDIRWHPPVDESERRDLYTVRSLAVRAKELDPDIELPAGVLKEIDMLLGGIELDAIDESKIGFRRHPMRWFLTGDWSIALPGYFYQRFNPDSGQVTLWYSSRYVHVTTFNFEPADLELKWPDVKAEEAVYLRYETETVRCVATLRPYQEDEKEGWLLQAKCNSFSSVALFSILFTDKDDLAWAEEALRTVQIRSSKVEVTDQTRSIH